MSSEEPFILGVMLLLSKNPTTEKTVGDLFQPLEQFIEPIQFFLPIHWVKNLLLVEENLFL